MNELTTVNNQEDKDDDVISIEDVQPAAMSPFEALSPIRQLDLFFRSRDKHEDALHLLAQLQQQALNIAVTKPKQKKISEFFVRMSLCMGCKLCFLNLIHFLIAASLSELYYGILFACKYSYQFIVDLLICFVLAQIKRSKDTP